MGSDPAAEYAPEADEAPRHGVSCPAFAIGRTPVTNAEYGLFVEAAGHRAPPHWPGGAVPSGREQHPVTYVSFADALAFCRWAGGRLPTDAEWEKAARGTDGRIYPWGDEPESRGNTDGRVGHLTAVGSFPGDVSPFGCLDMAGNVREYTVGPNPGVTCGRRGGTMGGYAWAATPCLANGLPWPSGALGVWKPEERNQIEGFRIACSR